MWIFDKLKAVVNRMFKNNAVKAYPGADVKLSGRMTEAMELWHNMADGAPYWVDREDDIITLKFCNYISGYAANLTTLDIGMTVTGSARADWLQRQFDGMIKPFLREKVDRGLNSAGIIIKPVGDTVVYYEDKDFLITHYNSNKEVTGAILRDIRHKNGRVYTRYEWDYLDNGAYWIYNKAFVSDNENETGREVALDTVDDWKDLEPVLVATRKSGKPIEKALFAYFKNPAANKTDTSSPYGEAIFANAVTELKGLDIAWSRNDTEVEDSKHVTLVPESAIRYNEMGEPKRKLPRFIRGIETGDDRTDTIHEHVATLLTEQRWKDINNRLSVIAVKCGFSPGTFVIDRHTGMITATQVEADDRGTIQTIKDLRDALKGCINNLLYALDVIADIYGYAPTGTYEATYNFGDITYNYEEDRAHWWNYVIQGKMPAWKFFEKFEGMSKEEYEELQADLKAPEPMFNDEE